MMLFAVFISACNAISAPLSFRTLFKFGQQFISTNRALQKFQSVNLNKPLISEKGWNTQCTQTSVISGWQIILVLALTQKIHVVKMFFGCHLFFSNFKDADI